MNASAEATIRPALVPDAPSIARLQLQVFPGRRLARFGEAFATEYFRAMLASPRSLGIVGVVDADQTLTGFAVGFIGPRGVGSPLLSRRTVRLAASALGAIVRRPSLVLQLARGLGEQHQAPVADDTAFLASIAIRDDARGRGLGARVLRLFIDQALERGAARMLLEVERDNAVAQSMYETFGFVCLPASADRDAETDPVFMRLELATLGTEHP